MNCIKCDSGSHTTKQCTVVVWCKTCEKEVKIIKKSSSNICEECRTILNENRINAGI